MDRMLIEDDTAGLLSFYADAVNLLERDQELQLLTSALDSTASGHGAAVAVCGDSGTGKSTLLDAACARRDDLRVLYGRCDPLLTPRPLGPVRDVAASAGLTPALANPDVSLAHVCEELFAGLATEPTVVVIEDLHWVDAASVEVLRFLVRRVESVPLTVLVSYRDTEVGGRHPARQLLGDFAQLAGTRSLDLSPLSLDAVRLLVAGTGLDAERVHGITGGNPYFVSQVAREPDRPMPLSVRDAVLGRTARLTEEDFDVLQLIAAAPDRLDDRMLPALAVDLPTLRRLENTGLLVRSRGGVTFRHELARLAIESATPPGGGSRLHARLLNAMEAVGRADSALLVHHAVAARDSDRATRYARIAAEEASAAGAHGEAAAFYETALQHLGDAPPRERAELLQRLSVEQYMTSRLDEAIANVRATFLLWKQAGDPDGLAGAHETCATYEYYQGHRGEAERQAEEAAAIARTAGSATAYAAARATQGFLAYMGNQLTLAHALTDEARGSDLTEDRGGPLLRTDVVQQLTELVGGHEEARGSLLDSIHTARDRGLDELASTGYSQLASIDVEQRRFSEAEMVLATSLPFTVERDIPICRHWQTAVRSRLRFGQGRWSDAVADAAGVLDEEGMPIARLWPLIVSGLTPLRLGEAAGDRAAPAIVALDAAWELAQQINEPLRRLAVLSALAEKVWTTGQPDDRVSRFGPAAVEEAQRSVGLSWAAGDLGVWLLRLGLPAEVGPDLATPFRLALEGRHPEAAAWWAEAGDRFAEALALGDSSDPDLRIRGVELLDQLGAIGTADRRRLDLRRDGVAAPQRPRASTRANPAGLTNRQLEVARLLARGLTNAEIASRLFISQKTAEHHVSAVLSKFGLPHRRSVIPLADELGFENATTRPN